MKMSIFWDVASYSLVEIDRRFRGDASSAGADGGSNRLFNVGRYLLDYMAQHPTRLCNRTSGSPNHHLAQ
jgi:hypothetical protein